MAAARIAVYYCSSIPQGVCSRHLLKKYNPDQGRPEPARVVSGVSIGRLRLSTPVLKITGFRRKHMRTTRSVLLVTFALMLMAAPLIAQAPTPLQLVHTDGSAGTCVHDGCVGLNPAIQRVQGGNQRLWLSCGPHRQVSQGSVRNNRYVEGIGRRRGRNVAASLLRYGEIPRGSALNWTAAAVLWPGINQSAGSHWYKLQGRRCLGNEGRCHEH